MTKPVGFFYFHPKLIVFLILLTSLHIEMLKRYLPPEYGAWIELSSSAFLSEVFPGGSPGATLSFVTFLPPLFEP